jgi:hypothetical protein
VEEEAGKCVHTLGDSGGVEALAERMHGKVSPRSLLHV